LQQTATLDGATRQRLMGGGSATTGQGSSGGASTGMSGTTGTGSTTR
jgi:hypothetical protein